MPQFTIETTPEEQAAVLEALRPLEGIVVPVRRIAADANLSQSRARYALVDLISAGKIRRMPIKAYNSHYIRYSYKIV